MEDKMSVKESLNIRLKRGNDIIEERKIDGKKINLLEELCKIFSNIKE